MQREQQWENYTPGPNVLQCVFCDLICGRVFFEKCAGCEKIGCLKCIEQFSQRCKKCRKKDPTARRPSNCGK